MPELKPEAEVTAAPTTTEPEAAVSTPVAAEPEAADAQVAQLAEGVAAVAVQNSAPDLSDLIAASVEIDILAEAIKTARN